MLLLKPSVVLVHSKHNCYGFSVILLQYGRYIVRFLTGVITGMFVVSSSHTDPMEEFSKLTQHQHTQQHQQPHKLPKWFSPNILRYYVLVHDVTEQAEAKYVLSLSNHCKKFDYMSEKVNYDMYNSILSHW